MNPAPAHPQGDASESRNDFSPITQFLLWCSGANLNILARCPSDINKFIGIGGAVLATGILAMISGGFAIRTIASSTGITIAFAIFWGLIIFNLDRFILASMRKGQNKGKELRLALPRILLALAISVIVSKPLEIEIARNQVNAHLETTTNMRLATDRNQKAARLDSMNTRLDSLKRAVDQIRSELAAGPESSSLYSQQKEATENAKSDYLSIQKSSNEELIKLSSERAEIESRYFGVDKKDWDESARSRHSRIKENQKAENKKIADAKARWDNEQDELQKIVEDFKAISEKRIEAYQQQIDALSPQIAAEKIKVDAAIDIAITVVNAYRNGFLAELEALDQLKSDPEHPSIWWASLGIMLLIILLELSPVMVKLMLPRGLYDECLEAMEIQQMNQARSDANAAIIIYNSRNETNVASSTAQSRAIRHAIERWDAEETLQQDNRYDLRTYLRTIVDNLDSHLQPNNPETLIASLRRPPSMARRGWVWMVNHRIFHFLMAGLAIALLIMGLIWFGKWVFEEEPVATPQSQTEPVKVPTNDHPKKPFVEPITPIPSEDTPPIQAAIENEEERSNASVRPSVSNNPQPPQNTSSKTDAGKAKPKEEVKNPKKEEVTNLTPADPNGLNNPEDPVNIEVVQPNPIEDPPKIEMEETDKEEEAPGPLSPGIPSNTVPPKGNDTPKNKKALQKSDKANKTPIKAG